MIFNIIFLIIAIIIVTWGIAGAGDILNFLENKNSRLQALQKFTQVRQVHKGSDKNKKKWWKGGLIILSVLFSAALAALFLT